MVVSPGFGQGRGLKPQGEGVPLDGEQVSPGFGQGRGLKRQRQGERLLPDLSPLASVRGGD